MRKEIYEMLCERLKTVGFGAIQHIDLWNHNVEFIEQEEQWARPAVFVEFAPVEWRAIVPGVEYRADVTVHLHVVTDWAGSVSADSDFREKGLEVFDLLDDIHGTLCGVDGETFKEFDLVGSQTNHNHEDLVEHVETFHCVGIKELLL